MHLREEMIITAAEVLQPVKTLKAGKAAGCDEIRPEILKALNQGVLWLSHVCQVAWCSGSALKGWKYGVIIPIHKKGARSECSNYRSICLLSPSGKVYAKCLEERYREIIEAKLDDTQCVPIVALQNKFSLSSNFREILGVCQRRLHMFCGPRYSIRPSSSWKAVEVFSGAQCWQPPVTGCQVTVFLLRSLCSCWRSLTTTVHSVSWTPTRVCAVTTPLHSHMNWSVKV